MQLPERKPNRLKTWDYSSAGAYFITICTVRHEWLLWRAAQRYTPLRDTDALPLSEYGMIVNDAIAAITKIYTGVVVDKYVVMPNHVHLIIVIQESKVMDMAENKDGRANSQPSASIQKPFRFCAPTISTIINQMKGYVTKQIGFPIWQKLYYDHIIRNHDEYERTVKYIDENPMKWQEDCYYI